MPARRLRVTWSPVPMAITSKPPVPSVVRTKVSLSTVRLPAEGEDALVAELGGARHRPQLERVGDGREVGRLVSRRRTCRWLAGPRARGRRSWRPHDRDLGVAQVAQARRVPRRRGGVVGARQERAAHAEGPRAGAEGDAGQALEVQLVGGKLGNGGGGDGRRLLGLGRGRRAEEPDGAEEPDPPPCGGPGALLLLAAQS